MKVRFLETRLVNDGSGQIFEEGRVYDLPLPSAERWIRRKLAEAVTEEPEPSVVFEAAPVVEPDPVEEPPTDPVQDVAAVTEPQPSEAVKPRRGRSPKAS